MRTRREVLLMGVAAAVLPLPLSACGGGETGPVEVAFDRDTCELCRMLISNPRFAAQVRGGPKRKVFKFDDIGDAMNWLGMQDWAEDPATEIWVRDYAGGTDWLDARSARYVTGVHSPMDYGFGAVADGSGVVGFAEMKAAVLERGSAYCDPPQPRTT